MHNRLFTANHPNHTKRIDNLLDMGPATLLGTECNINGMLFMEITVPKAICRKSAGLSSKWHNTTINNYSNSWGHHIDWNDHKIVASSGTFKFDLRYAKKECDVQLKLFQAYFTANGFKTELNDTNPETVYLAFTAMDKDVTLFINKYPHNCGGSMHVVKFDNAQALLNEPGNKDAIAENARNTNSPSFK